MEKPIKKTKWLIIWKFFPFHKWHKYLIDFWTNFVDELYVLVCSIKSENISWELRHKWVKESCNNAIVLHHNSENPQYPEDHTDFWKIWHDSIYDLVQDNVDYVFASEEYWAKLAEIFWAKFIPVNISRDLVNISWTKIRENPFKNWDFLPDKVKPHFVKKICFYWPESVGKTTLTQKLANYYNTVWVKEYARDYVDLNKIQEFNEYEIEIIAKWHKASENALAEQSNKIMFIDTDIITTFIRAEILVWKISDNIKNEVDEKDYDLYILLDIDVDFIEDNQRFFPDQEWRKKLYKRFENELKERNKKYIKISWNRDERYEKSIKEIDNIFFN
jgi:HTH-type transcriptional regulator, transcriptional repressor of NAD biosynthesis genes